jgi:hypothetical protein
MKYSDYNGVEETLLNYLDYLKNHSAVNRSFKNINAANSRIMYE